MMTADRISARELQELLAAGQPVIVVDIRSPADREWSIPGGTPGHTEESTTYLLNSAAAFTGDTLFLNSVGRPDLEGGTGQQLATRARLLHESVRRLLQLPEASQVLPGHVSAPVPFDDRVLTTTVATIRDNERGEVPGDPGELEAGANRCAVA